MPKVRAHRNCSSCAYLAIVTPLLGTRMPRQYVPYVFHSRRYIAKMYGVTREGSVMWTRATLKCRCKLPMYLCTYYLSSVKLQFADVAFSSTFAVNERVQVN